ncbi:HYR domain-containing protein [Flavobacterium sp. N502536]|uniref:HYR domain-containing protein n=1 Tax=Flavobacterium sp. N502536 TaxID=2986837 RepID=UPI0022230C89|nr:HYR domain-containing protein [Flavobacterium sp. N502536]
MQNINFKTAHFRPVFPKKYIRYSFLLQIIAMLLLPYMVHSQCGANLAVNPGFESGFQGWGSNVSLVQSGAWFSEPTRTKSDRSYAVNVYEGSYSANVSGGSVYQDFDTSGFRSVDYSFAFLGSDASGWHGGAGLTLQAGPPGGPYTDVIQTLEYDLNWHLVTGSYQVPANQTKTRFVFAYTGATLLGSDGGSIVYGTFIDDVSFKGVLNEPAVSFIGNNSICKGNSKTMRASGNSGATFNWYDATGTTLLYTGQSYTTPALSSETTYKVQQVLNSSCKSGFTSITVYVEDLPNASISGASKACVKTTLQADAYYRNSINLAKFVWYKDDAVINGETRPTLVVTASGNYKLKVISASINACEQTSAPLAVEIVPDIEKPVITCAANITQTADAGKCTANVTITNPTATDNCSTVFTFTGVRSDALALTAAYPLGKTTISWTAKDDSGNVSASCDQTITITDTEKPVITCADNMNQGADFGKCTSNVIITKPTATDNCSTVFTFTGIRSDALALTDAYPLGTTTISWTAKDGAGNVSASCDQTITITDTEKPVIICPANISQTADVGKCTANVTITNPTATDNCSTAVTFTGTRSDALALTAAYPLGKTTISWTAKDDSGNVSTSCDQTITITDTEKPVITCSANITQTADAGTNNTTVTIIDPTATDNCSTAVTFTGVRSDALALTDAYPVGKTTISWTAKDDAGNVSTSCDQTITVTDKDVCDVKTINASFEEPSIKGAPAKYQSVNQSQFPGWKTTASDGMMDILVTGFENISAVEGSQFVEVNGNVVGALYQDFDISEGVSAFRYSFAHRGRMGVDVMVLKAGPPGGPYTEVTRASTDNTAWQVYTGTYTIPASQKKTRFIFESLSSAGGSSTQGNLLDAIHFTATLDAPPVTGADKSICEGSSATLKASAIAGATVNWYDAAGTNLLYTGPNYTTPALSSETTYKVEQVTSTGCKSAKSDIKVTVNTKPTVSLSGASKACSTTTLTATTNIKAIANNNSVTVNDPGFVWYKDDAVINGETKETLVVTASGKYKVKATSSLTGCDQTSDPIDVVIGDTEKPVITCAANISQTADAGKCTANVTITNPTATDNCSTAVTFTGVRSDALALTAAYPLGKTTISWTAKDDSGNVSASCDQTITITDTEKPVITCAANISQTADAGKCTANVTITNPTATDNCSTAVTFTGVRSDALALTAAYPLGKTTISWTAKDDAGNVSASCDQTITITDTEKPVITCAANISQTADAGKCTANVTITNPTATDNCSTAVTFTGVRSDALALTAAYPVGKTTISWTAKDDAGNVSTSCDQTITISDSEKPVITCAANISQTADAGKCTANVTITNPTATDNCSTAVTFTGVRSDALALTAAYPVGKTTISWTAKDDAGNVSTSCDQTITVTDTEKPVITCPANITQTADAGKCTANVTITNPTATDNCSTAVTFTGVRSDALALTAAYPLGKTTISWTAKDDAGNVSTSCDQTITITDTEKPVITCAANISQTADAGKCTANVTITNPTATDNCSTAVTFTGVRSDALALTVAYPVGKTTISWTAKDDAGNVSASCDQTITISDSEKPVITCAANISQTADAGKCTANVTITNPTATDNCSTAVTFTGVRSDALALTAAYPLGKTTISWTAKDDSGNVSTSCDQTITITDTEKPVITCAANITQTADAGKNNANVTITNPTATDNCSTAVTFTGVRSDALALTAAYPMGKTTISWTAKDDAGNVSTSCDQTITITDTEKPVITCAADVATKADDGLCTATIALIAPTVNDNSAAVAVTNNAPAAFPVGVTTVVWTATDNSGNKATCEQKVTVYSLIKATDDAVASVNGAVGGSVVNVLDNDVLNCGVAKANELKIALAGKALPSGIDFNTATGTVSVKPNTPAGTYTFDYTICNLLNSSICGTATVKIDVVAPKIETPAQTPTVVVDPKTGTTPPITSDIKINDQPVTIGTKPGDVTVTIIKAPPGFILNPDGTVTVPPNTPGGTYTIDYKVCQVSNPANCVTGSVKVTVDAPKIETPVTTPTVVVDPKTGTTPPITSDIKINDQPVTIGTKPGDVTVTIIKAPPGFILNPDGTVTVPPNTPGGTYTIDYKVCQVSNPANCVTGSVKVTVDAPKIETPVTTPTVVVDPKTGTTPPLTSDIKINDQPVTIGTKPGDVTVTIIKAPPGFILNPDGTVTVPPNTPGGTYTIDYKVCQVSNPANCVTGSVKVTVDAPKIETPVTTPTVVVDPKTGTTPSLVTDVKINNQPVTIGTNPGDVTVTIIKAPPGFILNPDGTVTVPPNTPGGTYTIDYKVCQVSNPANCVTGSVKVTVDAPKIETPVTTPTVVVDPKTGTTPSLVTDVKINNQPVTIGTNPGDVTVTIIKAPPGFILNPDGTVTVPPNTPGGTYTIDYKVCQVSNPANCVTGSVKVTVDAPKIETPVTTPTVVVDPKTGTTPSLVTDVKINNQPVVIGTNPGDVTVIITKAPPGFILNPDGTVTVPPNTPGGIYTVEYQICQVGNPKNCTTGSVKIEVGGPTDACVIKVSNAFSPNGDLENDRFYIHGLECYPDNTVEIYNRWGRLVYECKHYNNVDRVFRGGNDELVGTYYYVIRYTDDKSRTHEKVGYLYIGK